ncbi:MAG: deoxyribonuclease IV, partial [Planctomycetales bacterium]
PLLGAHMSIAGGFHKAVERAAAAGMSICQIFTKNNNQWKGKPLGKKDAQRFQESLAEHGISHPLAHDSYLINMASPNQALWRKSLNAFVTELRRADLLGIPHVVAHPGAYVSSSEEAGLERIAQALDEVHKKTGELQSGCLLETTAGQGTNLGWKFEHLAAIFALVREPDRLGVCFDTCHVLAAGYPMASAAEYQATMDAFDHLVGLERIKAFHLNDSKRELGSRVDRHEHIGEGFVGLEPFRRILNDARFRDVPMYLETPKGDRDGENLDRVNLSALRALVKNS